MSQLPRENGRFVPGQLYSPETMIRPGERISPRTEFKKGERAAPATEFRKGQPARNHLPVGSVTVRHHNRHPRAFVKIAEPNMWRPRATRVWEQANGRLPRGYVIHHVDRNTLNDDLSNLELLSRADHLNEHRRELLAARHLA